MGAFATGFVRPELDRIYGYPGCGRVEHPDLSAVDYRIQSRDVEFESQVYPPAEKPLGEEIFSPNGLQIWRRGLGLRASRHRPIIQPQQMNVTPFRAGLVLGVGAALVQAYFKVIPPLAYGVCMVCHPRDLFNWGADHLFNLNWHYSVASTNWPLLTVPGVLAGALVASAQHGELRLRPARQSWFFFLNGFLMMNFGLILGSCPIRIVILERLW